MILAALKKLSPVLTWDLKRRLAPTAVLFSLYLSLSLRRSLLSPLLFFFSGVLSSPPLFFLEACVGHHGPWRGGGSEATKIVGLQRDPWPFVGVVLLESKVAILLRWFSFSICVCNLVYFSLDYCFPIVFRCGWAWWGGRPLGPIRLPTCGWGHTQGGRGGGAGV